jgi:hypothetical protein
MRRRACLLLFFVVPSVIGGAATAQPQAVPNASLQGVWEIVDVTPTGPGAKPAYRPNLGFWMFTSKHYAIIVDDADSPRPPLGDAQNATAEHLRAVWGPFVGNAGTYERSGDLVTFRLLVAKNPERMNKGDYALNVKVQGDTLTAVEVRSQTGPVANPTTVKLRRVE